MSNFQNLDNEEIEQDQLKNKLDLISITSSKNLENIKTAVDANTSKVTFPGLGTSSSTALAGDTTTISSAQSTAINANSLKNSFPGFGTTGGTSLEGNTALLQLGTSGSTALAGNTSLLQLGTSSSTALAGNTVTISGAQASAIVNNTNKTGITSVQSNNILNNNDKIGISLSQISAISSNTSGVSALVLAYPRNTILRHYNYTTADIYNDGTVKFNWDGTNKQLRFWILSIGTNEYMVGGVKIWKGTTEIRKSIYISQNVSTAYKYFTGPQTGASQSIVDNTYDLKTSYGTATYFLTPYLEQNYPSYEIKILIGYHLGWHTIHIKRFT